MLYLIPLITSALAYKRRQNPEPIHQAQSSNLKKSVRFPLAKDRWLASPKTGIFVNTAGHWKEHWKKRWSWSNQSNNNHFSCSFLEAVLPTAWNDSLIYSIEGSSEKRNASPARAAREALHLLAGDNPASTTDHRSAENEKTSWVSCSVKFLGRMPHPSTADPHKRRGDVNKEGGLRMYRSAMYLPIHPY